MRIFIDTANIEQIKEIHSWGILDGVTTNPSLIAKEGKDLRTIVEEIAGEVDGPISAEAISLDAEAMFEEGMELSSIHHNINIKLPMSIEGLKATKALYNEGVDVNMTLVFSAQQALLAAKAGARYVSPFIGRLDDIGQTGMDVVAEILDIYDNYDFDTEVIAASIRHPLHVTQAASVGAQVATIPHAILKKMISHPKTDEGIEAFLADWEKMKSL